MPDAAARCVDWIPAPPAASVPSGMCSRASSTSPLSCRSAGARSRADQRGVPRRARRHLRCRGWEVRVDAGQLLVAMRPGGCAAAVASVGDHGERTRPAAETRVAADERVQPTARLGKSYASRAGRAAWSSRRELRGRGRPASERAGQRAGRTPTANPDTSTTSATGPARFMTALAVDRRRRWGREDYLFFDFARSHMLPDREPAARTGPPSAASAPVAVRARVAGPGPGAQLARPWSGESAVRGSARRLETVSERFDAWESCVSWVPVTEKGDPDRRVRLSIRLQGHAPVGFRPALSHRPERLGRPGLHVPGVGRR